MQNQPNPEYKIEYVPFILPMNFPLTDLHNEKYSPSSEDVTYMHYHNYLEVGYCYEGCGVFFVNGKVLPFSAGDASIIFPNEMHTAQSDRINPSKWQFIIIDPLSLLSDLNIHEINLISNVIMGYHSFINIIEKKDQSEIVMLILEIFTELEKREYNHMSMIKSLVWSLMVRLSRVFDLNKEKVVNKYNNKISRIAPALHYISQNYMEPLCLNKLAFIVKMSVTNFRRLFTVSMNIAPSEYIFMVRIKMASILLLNTEHSILEISLKVGYTTISSFNRHFKNILEVSPREWKKRYKI